MYPSEPCKDAGRRRVFICTAAFAQTFLFKRLMSNLTQDQWRTLSPYLDEALPMPEAERSQWLASLRVQNPVVADRLEELFRSHRALSGEKFLESSSGEMPGGAGLAGQSIGVYTLQSQIGQ